MTPTVGASRWVVPAEASWLATAHALTIVVFLCSSLIDTPGTLRMGSVSASALLTVAYFGSALVLLVSIPGITRKLIKQTAPMILFLSWSVFSLAWTTTPFNGVQNLLSVATFVCLLLIGNTVASLQNRPDPLIARLLGATAMVASLLYVGCSAIFGADTDQVIGARNFALFALYGIAHQLARWRYGSRSGLVLAATLTTLVGISESRLALGIALALFPLSQLPARRIRTLLKTVFVTFVVAGLAYGAFIYFDSLRARFVTGDLSLEIAGFVINGSGRTAFWRVTAQSFWESPVIGNGAGSAEGLIESIFGQIRHPHGDYLRIVHDYGFVGLTLWTIGILTLLLALVRGWRTADGRSVPQAQNSLTAILCLLGFVGAMTMENAFVYVFTTAPLGLIVGYALGGASGVRRL